MTLTEFLLARIAEDEEVARDCPGISSSLGALGLGNIYDCDCGDHHGDYWLTIDPARVLAECEAKRRIVELHQPRGWTLGGCDAAGCTCGKAQEPQCNECGSSTRCGRELLCETLRLLALPYVDHSEYREEWRP